MSIHQQMLENIVKNVQFFHNFSLAQADKILSNCAKIRVNKGDILIKEGSVGQEIYILLAGALRVSTKKGKVILANIRPITVVGEIAMLLNQPRSASVIAVKDCHLYRISKSDLQPFFANDTQMELQLYRNLCEVLCDRLLKNNLIIEKYSKFVRKNK